jgi:hypothetical protein
MVQERADLAQGACRAGHFKLCHRAVERHGVRVVCEEALNCGPAQGTCGALQAAISQGDGTFAEEFHDIAGIFHKLEPPGHLREDRAVCESKGKVVGRIQCGEEGLCGDFVRADVDPA